MKTMLSVVCFFVSLSAVFSQSEKPLDKIISQLALYYAAHPQEKIILQTDKDFYQPGETVWFSYWRPGENEGAGEVSIRLLSSDGEVVISDKYRLSESIGNGDLLLPENLPAGNYFIAALLPGTKNAENCFLRKITVRPVYQSSLLLTITPKEPFLRKETDNEILVQVKSPTKGAVKNEKLVYTISSDKKTVNEGRLKTDDTGTAVIRFRLPENPDGLPFILSVSDTKKESVETVQLASETDRLTITFYPEGGTLLPDVPTKIGFYVTDKLGNPVDTEGEVRNSEGNISFRAKTFYKGFGLFSLKASANENYFLHIEKGQGREMQFPLPQANATGSSLSVVKTDGEFLWLNLTFADRSEHDVSVMASQGPNVYWAANLQINNTGLLKIPIDKLPQGIVLLSSFSDKGFLLNQRMVNIQEKEKLQIDIAVTPEKPAANEKITLQIKFSDSNDRPLPGIVCISVADAVWNNNERPALPVEITFNSVLKNKVAPGIDPGNSSQRLSDFFLIANEMENFDWAEVIGFKTKKQIGTGHSLSFSEEFEYQLKEKVKRLGQPGAASAITPVPDQYFVINSGLVQKKQKRSTASLPANDSYKKFLETSTNLLEVIKIIKPFSMEGNKIIFPGGKNSINSQDGALIVVDGQQLGTDASVLNGLNPHDIDKINVSTSPIDIQRYTGLNSVGLIEIFTKRGPEINAATAKKPELVLYDGDYRISREFTIAEKNSPRTTAFWNPRLFIDESGKTSLQIPAANVVSGFVITVEGVGENGQPGHATQQIKIDE